MHRFDFRLFIARRLIGSKSHKNSVSAPIIKIGIVAVAIGLTAMHIAVGTGFGLQQKIRAKITSFEGIFEFQIMRTTAHLSHLLLLIRLFLPILKNGSGLRMSI